MITIVEYRILYGYRYIIIQKAIGLFCVVHIKIKGLGKSLIILVQFNSECVGSSGSCAVYIPRHVTNAIIISQRSAQGGILAIQYIPFTLVSTVCPIIIRFIYGDLGSCEDSSCQFECIMRLCSVKCCISQEIHCNNIPKFQKD